MRQNILLGILIVVVTAVTALNHYTTRVSTEYFLEAQERASVETFYAAVTSEAQEAVKDVAILAQAFLKERDEARKYASFLYEKVSEFYEIIQAQNAYIEELEKKLLETEPAVPKPKHDFPIQGD